ncbi:MAG: hypothetical protein JRN67_11290, partial [Nitrososphaerota archaeon]|nr:hypothetical protein [Nitrososphaerota archaeon]
EAKALSAAGGWYLNPIVIWVSAGWGQFDTLPVLFTVLGFYFLMTRRFAISGLALTGAILMKYYAVVLIVPMLIIAWRGGRRRGATFYLGALFSSLAVFLLPEIVSTAAGFAWYASGELQPNLEYSGLSFWSALTLFVPFPQQAVVATILIVSSLAVAYLWMSRARLADLSVYATYIAIPIVLLLFFYRFVAENYFVWVIPFAAILALPGRRRALFWAVSGLAFVSSVTDSLLPYYMLPVAPWVGNLLVNMVSFAGPYRVAQSGVIASTFSFGKLYLAGLGITSAVLLTLILLSWTSNPESKKGPDEEVSGTRSTPPVTESNALSIVSKAALQRDAKHGS